MYPRNKGQVQGQIWRSNAKVKFHLKLTLKFDLQIWPWTWPLFRGYFKAQLIYYWFRVFVTKIFMVENDKSYPWRKIDEEELRKFITVASPGKSRQPWIDTDRYRTVLVPDTIPWTGFKTVFRWISVKM